MIVGNPGTIRKNKQEIKKQILDGIVDIVSHLTKSGDVIKKLMIVTSSLHKDYIFAKASHKALMASDQYLTFSLEHPEDHSSREWYQHIGRLGGCYGQVYRRKKEVNAELLKFLPFGDPFKKVFERYLPVISIVDKNVGRASRKNYIKKHQHNSQNGNVNLAMLYQSLERDLRKAV